MGGYFAVSTLINSSVPIDYVESELSEYLSAYKTLLGYEKGPDGEMVVNAEQAETVRKIYELYLSGQTLRNIKETLETGGFKNSAGTTEWTTSNLRTILSDEKYCGDVLLQKTFIRDCISKQVIRRRP